MSIDFDLHYSTIDSDPKHVKIKRLNKETKGITHNVKHFNFEKVYKALPYIIAFAIIVSAIFIVSKLTGEINGDVVNTGNTTHALEQPQITNVEAPQPAPVVESINIPNPPQTPVVQETVQPSAPKYAPTTDNEAKNFIYQKESSMRLDAVNSLGCIGLGQSCPQGGKTPALAIDCPDWQTNFACQDAFWNNYANTHCDFHTGISICYKGWQGAYNFWLQYRYW